ncbi:MAG: M23 family metallopeptidase [Muribaculaceae bacterium]|nr:M23 family metallopeptidase [Muribaculaceae bacterium]
MTEYFNKIMIRLGLKKEQSDSDPIKFPHLWVLSFGDQSRFKRIWTLRLRTRHLIFFSFLLFIIVSFLGIVIVVKTPLRSFLPGYLDTDERHSLEALAEKLDSISAIYSIQNDYLSNIRGIFLDSLPLTTPPVEDALPATPRDSVRLIPVDSILPTSETERRFAREYERRERHNLSVLSPVAAEGMVFHRPLGAATPISGNADNSVEARSMTLSSTASAPVAAVYRGTVISTYNEPGNGVTVVIQHPREFVTIYTGLSSVYVKPGDKVNSGTRIGTLSDKAPLLTLSLWRNGVALDPASYIPY